jgi:hypothetical protein
MAEPIKLYSCNVKRRGKAAKGTIPFQSFGIPILNDDGIAVAFDYSEFDKKYSEKDALSAIRKIGNSIAIMLRGADMTNRSMTGQSQGLAHILTARVWAAGLAIDKDEARTVAVTILTTINNLTKAGFDAPSVDAFLEKRKAVVEDLKKKGLWVPREPRKKRKKRSKSIPTEGITLASDNTEKETEKEIPIPSLDEEPIEEDDDEEEEDEEDDEETDDEKE